MAGQSGERRREASRGRSVDASGGRLSDKADKVVRVGAGGGINKNRRAVAGSASGANGDLELPW